jgi:hypothetical protein
MEKYIVVRINLKNIIKLWLITCKLKTILVNRAPNKFVANDTLQPNSYAFLALPSLCIQLRAHAKNFVAQIRSDNIWKEKIMLIEFCINDKSSVKP